MTTIGRDEGVSARRTAKGASTTRQRRIAEGRQEFQCGQAIIADNFKHGDVGTIEDIHESPIGRKRAVHGIQQSDIDRLSRTHNISTGQKSCIRVSPKE